MIISGQTYRLCLSVLYTRTHVEFVSQVFYSFLMFLDWLHIYLLLWVLYSYSTCLLVHRHMQNNQGIDYYAQLTQFKLNTSKGNVKLPDHHVTLLEEIQYMSEKHTCIIVDNDLITSHSSLCMKYFDSEIHAIIS